MKLKIAVLPLVLCLALPGCGKKKEAAPPAPEVTVAKPIKRNVTVFDEFTGSTAAVKSVNIRARVEGFLEKIDFEDSAFVKKNDLLFVIEQPPYEAKRDYAEATLKSAEAELEAAQLDLERAEVALKSNAVSKEEVSNRKAKRDMAAARVEEAKADLVQAKLNLSYTEVRSPIEGRVSRHLVDVGNLVGAGEKTLLTTVVTMDPIYVYFDADERKIIRHLARSGKDFDDKPDISFYVGLDTEEGFPHEGKLDYIDNTVDPATGTIQVRGVVPNKEGKLYPGLYARVRLPAQLDKGALLVEERALGTDLGGKYLYVLNDKNIVERRGVELGSLQDDSTRVIQKGIKEGETYIVDGLQMARPGLPVTPKPEGQKPPGPGAVAEGESGKKAGPETAPAPKGGKSAAETQSKPGAGSQKEE